MDVDVGSDDLCAASLRNLAVIGNELARSGALCQSDDNGLLALEQGLVLWLLRLDDDYIRSQLVAWPDVKAEPTGDLVLDRLAVGGKIVHSDNRSRSFDALDSQVKVGFGLREVLLGNLHLAISARLLDS